MSKKDRFTKIGFVMAALGMAIGTGNLWRFPRVAAESGGGSFIIAWLVFLFLWAIPLLIIEFTIGNNFRKGILSSFKRGMGKKFTWMGAFVAMVSTAILFYYSVVTGWCMKYFFASLFNYKSLGEPVKYWSSFTGGIQPIFFNALALIIGGSVIVMGVSHGIERVNNILIPTLFALLIFGVIKAFTLPGGLKGLNFLFSPDFENLKDYKVWLSALNQSAWSTGAGWGLILTYAIYTSKKDDPVYTSTTIGFGNNSASLLAGMLVIPTLFFALKGNEAKLLKILESGNQGLTFISVPSLFQNVPLGQLVLALFFLALSFAAFSSLLSLLELPTRILIDAGLKRKKAILLVISTAFIFGLPSAISMKFFNNQDWVWSCGLMVSGFFFSIFVMKYGVTKFRKELVEKNSEIKIGKAFDIVVKYFIPVEFAVMIVWWFSQSFKLDKWYHIFSEYSLLTVLSQWGFFLIMFIVFNKILSKKVAK